MTEKYEMEMNYMVCTLCPQENLVWFLAISQLLIGQIQKVLTLYLRGGGI